MQKLEGESQNIVAENIEKLKELFPEVFIEGKIDFEVLKKELDGLVETREERYSFTWNGKAEARRIAQTPSTGTLRPAPEESVDWNTTQNLFIEGDNLEVLKLLQKSYHSKVKMIYIDPPYNTGKEFIYPDNFRDNLDTYLEYTGQKDHEGRKFGTNAETSGRYHTNWLNMMYPRLKLARNLLRDDGVIFISIDDNEVHNLRKICDEIFGEANFVANLVYDRNRKNDAKYFSVGHEYMLVYFKNKSFIQGQGTIFRAPKDGVEELKELFNGLRINLDDDWDAVREKLLEFYSSIPDDDSRAPIKRFRKVDQKGPYRDDGNINWPGGGGPRYEVLHPVTNMPCKLPASGWRYPTVERFWEEHEKGRVVFGPDESTVPRVRTNLFENNDQVLNSVRYSYAQTATNNFLEIFDGVRVFENPKPITDIFQLVQYVTGVDDVIVDFFAGSGTTTHAVMKLNAEDDSNRRCISVQLPELTDEKSEAFKAGYKTIAEISKERIRRAAKKIAEEHPNYTGDLGFKVFKLDSSNIKTWDADYGNVEQSLLDAVDNIKADRTSEDLLYEILLKYGLDLTLPIETKDVASKTAYVIGLGALVICLDDAITLDTVEAIATLKDEYQPEVMRVVFKDASFADDVVKTNAIQILKQHGIDDVKSV